MKTLGGQFGLFLLMLFLAGTAAAQNCGGKERWGPKDGTDPQAPNIDLTNITPEAVTDLVAIHQPQLPADNTTRIVPDETHVYRVQARLVKWKHESDGDYHLVLTDDTLNYGDESANPPVPPTGHSFIGEVPDPSCFSGSDGSFGSQTPFATASLRLAKRWTSVSRTQTNRGHGMTEPVLRWKSLGSASLIGLTSRRGGLQIILKSIRSFRSSFWANRLLVRAQPQLQVLSLRRLPINGNTR